MKNKRILFLLSFCLSLAIAWGEIPPAKVIFQQYMNQAQTFANNFPREESLFAFRQHELLCWRYDLVQGLCHSRRKADFQSDQPPPVCGTGGSDRTYNR